MNPLRRLRDAVDRRVATEVSRRTGQRTGRRSRLEVYGAVATLADRYGYRDEGLGAAEFKVFSQNGEDGVIAELFARLGTVNDRFVEFGTQDGLECNTRFLADVRGWGGWYFEADTELANRLAARYANNDDVAVKQALVTPANVNALFADAGIPREWDLLSIDVDGQDYHIWEALDAGWRPRVVVMEYNSHLPASEALVEPPAASSAPPSWRSTDYFGCSLGAAARLAAGKGYTLVHADMAGVNLFFVRSDLAGALPAGRVVRRSPNYGLAGGRHRADDTGRTYLRLGGDD